MLLGLVLSACGGEATVEEPAVVENTTENISGGTSLNLSQNQKLKNLLSSILPQLDGMFDIFIDDMEAYNTIGLDALNTALVENPPFLLDVRSAEEAGRGGHIEGSVLIPLRDLADNLAYLPSFDTPIVSYCGSGWRCTIALTMLEAMGWEDVKGLKGDSFGGWLEGDMPTLKAWSRKQRC